MTPPRSRPAIRPVAEGDALTIADLVTHALGDKYRPALGGRAARGVAALVRRDVREGTGAHRWLAEIDGRVAGSVSLALGQQVDAGFPGALADAVGWTRAIRATLVLSLLGHGRLAPDEAYVDELAVAGWARRRGVGRALLETCAAEARSAGRERLTLWVTINNGPARSLYETTGFREARRRRWLAGRLLFRAPGAIFMERRLPSRPSPAHRSRGPADPPAARRP